MTAHAFSGPAEACDASRRAITSPGCHARPVNQTASAAGRKAAVARSAGKACVFQMPQHRVHRRRPRLPGAANLAADAHGSETAPAGQPRFGHLTVLPRSGARSDRITLTRSRCPGAAMSPAGCVARRTRGLWTGYRTFSSARPSCWRAWRGRCRRQDARCGRRWPVPAARPAGPAAVRRRRDVLRRGE
jgi:hypothetical protein